MRRLITICNDSYNDSFENISNLDERNVINKKYLIFTIFTNIQAL